MRAQKAAWSEWGMKAADEPKRMGAAAAADTATTSTVRCASGATTRALPLLYFVLFHSFLESSPLK